MMRGWHHGMSALMAGLVSIGLVGCCPSPPVADGPAEEELVGPPFGYRQWIAPEVAQKVVIIGIHGFCGASSDYTNLGDYLLEHQPETGLYAYELRGQGSDPIVERRGDIGHPGEWYRDLHAFTQLVRGRHPDAKIVWFGESMGALIATHAVGEGPGPSCDGLVLSSPIVRFRDEIPDWTPALVQVAATALPLARISLETLMTGQDVQVTQQSFHGVQVKKNAYHIEDYTLRLIATLSRLIMGMNDCAGKIRTPVLVLHGGQDFFNTDGDVRGFVARVPDGTSITYRNYPKAYHLLMYDRERQRVFRDVRRWIRRLQKGEL